MKQQQTNQSYLDNELNKITTIDNNNNSLMTNNNGQRC